LEIVRQPIDNVRYQCQKRLLFYFIELYVSNFDCSGSNSKHHIAWHDFCFFNVGFTVAGAELMSKKKVALSLSPLSLLTLAACGGGGGGGGSNFVSTAGSTSGFAFQGPLSNALIYIDYDDAALGNSATVRTGADGSYTLSTLNDNYTIVVVTDDSTVDTSSGSVFSGVTMKAASGGTVVSTATTIMVEGNLTVAQLNTALGLAVDIDHLTFNPFAAKNINTADALAVEKVSKQIFTIVNAFAGAVEGSGASQTNAFKTALQAVVDVITAKVGAGGQINLTDNTVGGDIDGIKVNVNNALTGAQKTHFTTMQTQIVDAIGNVNTKIAAVTNTDLTLASTKNIFSTTGVLTDQIKKAVEDEVGGGTGFIKFKVVGEVNTSIANKAPENITLNSEISLGIASISEAVDSLVIGILGTTDADQTSGVAFTYALAEVAGSDYASFSINQATGALSFTAQPDYETKSSYSVTIISKDEGGKSFSKTFTINVTDVNDAPNVANAIADQTIAEDIGLSFQFNENTFADVDSDDVFSYTATLSDGSALPSWLVFDAATRTFSGTPLNADVGIIAVKVTATDGKEAAGSDTFNITVTNTYDMPTVANPIVDQTIAEDSTLSFQFNTNVFSHDDVTNTLTYAATLSDGNSLPSWLIFNASTRTFSGTPLTGDVGDIAVKVSVTDGEGATVSDTFKLTVTNTNDAPTVANAIADQTIAEDSALSFQFNTNVFADVDAGDTITYTATLSNDDALPTWLTFDAATRTFGGTPLNANVGSIAVKVTATDAGTATVSDTFNITVTNTNDAPAVKAGNEIADQTFAEDTALISFQFDTNVFEDEDVGDVITAYSATLSDGSALPTWLTFNPLTRTFGGSPTNSDVGTIAVKVTATDAAGAAVSDTFDLEVTNTNDAPTLANAIADQTIAEDSALSFQFNANVFADVDVDDTITFTATLSDGTALPAWMTFTAATRTFTGTPLNADVGTIAVKVTATDAANLAVSDTFNLTVTNTNDAPIVANAIADQAAAQGTALSFQFNTNVFADADVGDTITYTATGVSGGALPTWLTFNAATRTFSGTPTASDSDLTVSVIATDAAGATQSDSFNIRLVTTGGSGTDTVVGNSAANILYGGTGAGIKDTLTGNGGADTFVCSLADAVTTLSLADVISDFTNGTDLIGLEDRVFTDLTISNSSGDTKIVDTGSGKVLFVLDTFDFNLIDSTDFVVTDFV
jgi:hypothetical protein